MKINLGSMYRPVINYPNLKMLLSSNSSKVNIPGRIMTLPFYTVNSTDFNGLEHGEAEEAMRCIEKNPMWARQCESYYSSPTNVRRLVLNRNNCSIITYKPMILAGKPARDGRKIEIKTNRLLDDGNPAELINEAIKGLVSGNTGENEITGEPISSLLTQWRISNLEELVLDEAELFSSSNPHLSRVIERARAGQNIFDATADLEPSVTIMKMREKYESGQFKRLKAVSIVSSELATRLSKVSQKELDDSNSFTLIEYAMRNRWVKDQCMVYMTPKAHGMVLDFAVRRYYKFDTEFLVPYAAQFRREVAEMNERQIKDPEGLEVDRAVGRYAEPKVEASNKELANALRTVENRFGANAAQIIKDAMRLQVGDRELKALIGS